MSDYEVVVNNKVIEVTVNESQPVEIITIERGPTGPRGVVGPKGETGPQGEVGQTGLTGDIGPQGIQGVQGPIGLTGDIGPQGIQGPIGLTGASGIDGQDGTMTFEELTPEQRLTLKGDKGDTGDIGPQGIPGEVGLIGLTGPQGIPGVDGVDGSDATVIISNTLIETVEGKALDATQGKILNDDLITHKADLASQEVGKGASLIGLNDSVNKFVATNVEGAMSELFTNVSNGKSLVGGAITGVDNSVVIPTDPTFQQLASAIGSISTGKKWASGTVTMTNAFYTVEYATTTGTTTSRAFTVSGLTFKPSYVIAVGRNPANQFSGGLTVYEGGFGFTPTVKSSDFSGANSPSGGFNAKPNVRDLYINSTGFRLHYGGQNGDVVNWIAIE